MLSLIDQLVYNPTRCGGFLDIMCRVIFVKNSVVIFVKNSTVLLRNRNIGAKYVELSP
jgi:hypothetical protein